MAFMINLMKGVCIYCENEVHALFRTQNELNNFQCDRCPDFIEYLNYIEQNQIRD